MRTEYYKFVISMEQEICEIFRMAHSKPPRTQQQTVSSLLLFRQLTGTNVDEKEYKSRKYHEIQEKIEKLYNKYELEKEAEKQQKAADSEPSS